MPLPVWEQIDQPPSDARIAPLFALPAFEAYIDLQHGVVYLHRVRANLWLRLVGFATAEPTDPIERILLSPDYTGPCADNDAV